MLLVMAAEKEAFIIIPGCSSEAGMEFPRCPIIIVSLSAINVTVFSLLLHLTHSSYEIVINLVVELEDIFCITALKTLITKSLPIKVFIFCNVSASLNESLRESLKVLKLFILSILYLRIKYLNEKCSL